MTKMDGERTGGVRLQEQRGAGTSVDGMVCRETDRRGAEFVKKGGDMVNICDGDLESRQMLQKLGGRWRVRVSWYHWAAASSWPSSFLSASNDD